MNSSWTLTIIVLLQYIYILQQEWPDHHRERWRFLRLRHNSDPARWPDCRCSIHRGASFYPSSTAVHLIKTVATNITTKKSNRKDNEQNKEILNENEILVLEGYHSLDWWLQGYQDAQMPSSRRYRPCWHRYHDSWWRILQNKRPPSTAVYRRSPSRRQLYQHKESLRLIERS